MTFEILSHLSIVLLGDHSPAAMHPLWFANRQIITSEDAESAELKVASEHWTEFKTQRFFLQCLNDRFILKTELEQNFEYLVQIATQYLDQMAGNKISKLGINLELHFNLTPAQKLTALSRLLPTAETSAQSKSEFIDLRWRNPRAGKVNGFRGFKVMQSKVFDQGLAVEVNDHYETDDEDREVVNPLGLVLRNGYERSLKESEKESTALLTELLK